MQTIDLKMSTVLYDAFFNPRVSSPDYAALVARLGTRIRRHIRRTAVRHGRPPKSSSFLDASSVAEFLGVSRRWVMEHTRTGNLPALRFGKVFRYKMSAIEAWLEGQHAKR
jgi:excisionase family DNA binding protein